MTQRVNVKFKLELSFNLYSEEGNYKTFEFLAFGKALREAATALLDGDDTIHDYIQEAIPDGIELTGYELSDVSLSAIGGYDLAE